MSTIVMTDTAEAGAVLGVHGGTGVMRWLRAATGAHLAGHWDGIEWVALEPGARGGLHTHSVTEELWYFLRGTGEAELNGERFPIAPETIVLTPLGSSHAVWNLGDEPLEFVVIEVFPPAIHSAIPQRRPTDEPTEGN